MAKIALINGIAVFLVEEDFPFMFFRKDSKINREFVKDRKPIMVLSADNDVNALDYFYAHVHDNLSKLLYCKCKDTKWYKTGDNGDEDVIAIYSEKDLSSIDTDGKTLYQISEELDNPLDNIAYGYFYRALVNNTSKDIMFLDFSDNGYNNNIIVIFEGFDMSKIKFLDVEGEDCYSIGHWFEENIDKNEEISFIDIDDEYQYPNREKKKRLNKFFKSKNK